MNKSKGPNETNNHVLYGINRIIKRKNMAMTENVINRRAQVLFFSIIKRYNKSS